MSGFQWGGSEALWHALANYCLDGGQQTLISIYDWGSLHEKVQNLQEKGATIHVRKRFNPNASLPERIRRFLKKRKPSFDKDYFKIIEFRPDVVFISQGESFDLAVHHKPFYQLLRKCQIPFVLVCHSHMQYSFLPPSEIYPGAVDIFSQAEKIFFVSKRQWALTERRLATKLDNGEITWNPLNLKLPDSPLPMPASESVNLAIVASLNGMKGHDTAFEVFSTKVWKNRIWKLNIYGSGEALDYLKALATYYGINEKVHFRGHTADIIQVWRENHALLIPSASEGLPISLVEAMACGRFGIVTDVGGNTEIVTDGETGFIACSPSTHSFADALESAWRNRKQWQQIGSNAFENINSVLELKPEEKVYMCLEEIVSSKKNSNFKIQ